MVNTEGLKLEELPDVELPIGPTDLLELIRRREDAPERFKNYRSLVASGAIPDATELVVGKANLSRVDFVVDAVGNSSVVTPQGLMAALVKLLEERVLAGADITLDYDTGAGTLTISAGTPEFMNVMRVIGHNTSSGDAESNPLPGIAPVYIVGESEIDAVYQRYRIYDADLEEEMSDFCVCAIDRSFAISCQLQSFGELRYVAVTRHFKDANLKTYANWVAESTLIVGDTVELIDCGADYSPVDVVMLGLGKFIVVAEVITSNLTVIQFPVVTFTSPTSHSILFTTISAVDFGLDVVFDTAAPKVAFNPNTGEYTAVFKTIGTAGYNLGVHGTLLVEFDPETGAVNGGTSGDTGDIFQSGLVGIDQDDPPTVEYMAFEFDNSNFYYGTADISYQTVKIADWTDYGSTLRYKTFTTRTVALSSTDAVVYNSLSSEIALDLSALVDDKLTALGFDYGYGFGSISAYLS